MCGLGFLWVVLLGFSPPFGGAAVFLLLLVVLPFASLLGWCCVSLPPSCWVVLLSPSHLVSGATSLPPPIVWCGLPPPLLVWCCLTKLNLTKCN